MQQNLDRLKFKVLNNDTNKIENGSFFICDETGDLYKQIIDWDLHMEPVDFNFTILQSTDLKDKNGKLIYEGYILETKDKKIFTVQYGLYDTNGKNGQPSCSYGFYLQSHHKEHIADCYKLHQIDDICCYMPPYVIENPIYASEVLGVEVIGNIYEQPQLLEKL